MYGVSSTGLDAGELVERVEAVVRVVLVHHHC